MDLRVRTEFITIRTEKVQIILTILCHLMDYKLRSLLRCGILIPYLDFLLKKIFLRNLN
jgi:hypothetical protein